MPTIVDEPIYGVEGSGIFSGSGKCACRVKSEPGDLFATCKEMRGELPPFVCRQVATVFGW